MLLSIPTRCEEAGSNSAGYQVAHWMIYGAEQLAVAGCGGDEAPSAKAGGTACGRNDAAGVVGAGKICGVDLVSVVVPDWTQHIVSRALRLPADAWRRASPELPRGLYRLSDVDGYAGYHKVKDGRWLAAGRMHGASTTKR